MCNIVNPSWSTPTSDTSVVVPPNILSILSTSSVLIPSYNSSNNFLSELFLGNVTINFYKKLIAYSFKWEIKFEASDFPFLVFFFYIANSIKIQK